MREALLEMRRRDREAISAMAANLLTDVLKKLVSQTTQSSTADDSIIRLVQTSCFMDEETFMRKTLLSEACHKTLRRYPDVSRSKETSLIYDSLIFLSS